MGQGHAQDYCKCGNVKTAVSKVCMECFNKPRKLGFYPCAKCKEITNRRQRGLCCSCYSREYRHTLKKHYQEQHEGAKMKRANLATEVAPCRSLVVENILNVRQGKELTAPLATLNRSCEFKAAYERIEGQTSYTDEHPAMAKVTNIQKEWKKFLAAPEPKRKKK